jgi:hypothetical protein
MAHQQVICTDAKPERAASRSDVAAVRRIALMVFATKLLMKPIIF